MYLEILTVFLLLLAGHALGDFALQSNYIATEKARSLWILLMHSLIHGAIVFGITNSSIFLVVETVLHAVIDRLKTSGKIDFKTDQALHVLCKVAYTAAFLM